MPTPYIDPQYRDYLAAKFGYTRAQFDAIADSQSPTPTELALLTGALALMLVIVDLQSALEDCRKKNPSTPQS